MLLSVLVHLTSRQLYFTKTWLIRQPASLQHSVNQRQLRKNNVKLKQWKNINRFMPAFLKQEECFLQLNLYGHILPSPGISFHLQSELPISTNQYWCSPFLDSQADSQALNPKPRVLAPGKVRNISSQGKGQTDSLQTEHKFKTLLHLEVCDLNPLGGKIYLMENKAITPLYLSRKTKIHPYSPNMRSLADFE